MSLLPPDLQRWIDSADDDWRKGLRFELLPDPKTGGELFRVKGRDDVRSELAGRAMDTALDPPPGWVFSHMLASISHDTSHSRISWRVDFIAQADAVERMSQRHRKRYPDKHAKG